MWSFENEKRCSNFVVQFNVENNAIVLSENALAITSSVCDNETMPPPDLRKSPWPPGSAM